ncbi:PoNe immunity protein domain-containing protein [Butyrivibrio sp. XB500-5]|uniref:PoNe immunity protein domain-containing protein n=1 Tax=Butyrivibrio sp. XB500-5 TaxID=2364880 RepID=UPI001314E209|nr:PoNe immunity protein domain-containing protein [Butyrivibrio sp. XB500-5]
MRDTRCSSKFLEVVLKVSIPHITKLKNEICDLEECEKNGIQRHPKKNVEVIYNFKKGLIVDFRDILDAQYSLNRIDISYEELFDMFVEYAVQLEFKNIGYIVFLRFFSLGIMLELGKDKLKPLVDKLDKDEIDDILLGYLAEGYGLKRAFRSTKFYRETPYANAALICEEAVTDKAKAKEMLKEYMKNYLKAHSDMGWPKAAKDWADYKGLWSYEAAAISKLFGIDDSELKGDMNYPYDLAHYKNGEITAHNIEIIKPVKEEINLDVATNGITNNRELEGIVPPIFQDRINELISDYSAISDKEFWTKYNLREVWFECEQFSEDRKKEEMLGMLIVFELVELGYILQIDWKEDFEDYEGELKNYWNKDKRMKVVSFVLDNDQQYYALVPTDCNVKSIYEIPVNDI